MAACKDVQWPQAEFSKARAWQDESWQREDNTQCDTLFDEDFVRRANKKASHDETATREHVGDAQLQ